MQLLPARLYWQNGSRSGFHEFPNESQSLASCSRMHQRNRLTNLVIRAALSGHLSLHCVTSGDSSLLDQWTFIIILFCFKLCQLISFCSLAKSCQSRCPQTVHSCHFRFYRVYLGQEKKKNFLDDSRLFQIPPWSKKMSSSESYV